MSVRRVQPVAGVGASRAYAGPPATTAGTVKLDANEGPRLPAGLQEVLAGIDLERARCYPKVGALTRSLADLVGVGPERVLVTAGGDEALERICRVMLEPGRDAIATTPTFEMIPRYVRATGAALTEVPWFGGEFPTERVIERVTGQTAAIFVVTPNNPTGGVASERDLVRLAEAAPGALLVVDLAYTEFADVDLTPAALAIPNAIVVRTLSKAWGLAGLRVGWAAGSEELIGWLASAGNPYSVSGVSAAIAEAWLERGAPAMRAGVDRVRLERADLSTRLRSSGARVLESQGNFVLAGFAGASSVHERLLVEGVSVRKFASAELEGWLRITCPGDAGDFERLTRALASAMKGVSA